MADRKATNKYYPPDYDPKYGGLNKFVGSHPLRERAKKLDQGILVIRFEMPYNVWCGGCGIHIARGKRYNAEKKQVGKYFSTPIYQFRMRCHLCPNYMEIKTDPEHSDYEIVSGAKRKEETWDEKDSETMKLQDEEETKKLAEDPFYRLEHQTEDVRKAKESAPSLLRLQEIKDDVQDDYALNSALRGSFRKRKKELAEEKKEREAKNLSITLLPTTETDRLMAQSAFSPDRVVKRRTTTITPIFATATANKATSAEAKKKEQLRALASSLYGRRAATGPTPARTGASIVVTRGAL